MVIVSWSTHLHMHLHRKCTKKNKKFVFYLITFTSYSVLSQRPPWQHSYVAKSLFLNLGSQFVWKDKCLNHFKSAKSLQRLQAPDAGDMKARPSKTLQPLCFSTSNSLFCRECFSPIKESELILWKDNHIIRLPHRETRQLHLLCAVVCQHWNF